MQRDELERKFNELMERFRPLIYKVCYMYAGGGEPLKDLMQDVSANIWQGLPGFRAESGYSTWVYRVTLNTCVSFLRRNSRHDAAVSLDDVAYGVADTSGERDAQLREMYRMIGRLGAIDKAVVLMWLDGHSYVEIADVTGLTRTNVASRLHRAKQRLIEEKF